jgi:hypothetical protein
MVMPVIDIGDLLNYKPGMASLILSLLAATLAAVPVWAIFGPAQALGTAIGLALVLWPLMALSMRIMGMILAFLSEAITNHRASG